MKDISPKEAAGIAVISAGFSIASAAMNMLSPSLNSYIGYSILGVGIFICVIGLYVCLPLIARMFGMEGFYLLKSKEGILGFPFRILVPLKFSAQKAYDELNETSFGQWVNDTMGDDVMAYLFHALTEQEMFGIKPPGTRLILIERGNGGLGNFKDNGEKWGGVGRNDITHHTIKISRKTLANYIKEKRLIRGV